MESVAAADDGTIGDAHAVVQLVFVLEAAQDRNGVGHGRLVDEHRLKTPGESCVLFDMLSVLVERRGTDAVKFTAGKGRLQHVGSVHGAIGLAGADQGVQLVDEEDDIASTMGDLLKQRLQPLLEFAAVFRPGNEGAEIERQELPVAQAFGHVTIDDTLGQPLSDRGLADAGLADQHRVVLGPAREDLDDTADLLIPADHRIELAVPGLCGEVAGIFLERIVALLGGRGVGGAAFA